MLPVITVNSRLPGLLLVNGVNAGEVGEQEYVTMPLPAEGRCYLHYLPVHTGVDHCAVRIFAKQGVLTLAEDTDAPVTLVQWPSFIHEVTFYPTRETRQDVPLAPETLCHLTVGDTQFLLLKYGTLWAAAEQGQQTVLAQALPGEAVTGTLHAFSGGVAAVGDTREGKWGALFHRSGDGWVQSAYQTGDDVRLEEDGTLRIWQRLGDAADHRRIITCRVGQQPMHTLQTGAMPVSRDEMARAFLQACSLQEYAEAAGYLSAALRRQISGTALKEFVGEVYTCGPARYCPPPAQDEAAMALFRKSGEHTLQAYPLAFRFVQEEGHERIDDIRPL